MRQAEFFQTQDAATQQLNLQGERLCTATNSFAQSWEETRAMRADYMRAIINAGDIHALKYALFKGMENPGGKNDYPSTTRPIHEAVETLSEEDPEYTPKFSGMLARLIDPRELPPIDPNHDAHWVPGEQHDYRYYTTMLLHTCSQQPRSAELFEAGYALLTSGDPRIHGHDVYQSTRFTDRLIWSMLAIHQTDRRMQKTWEAALKQEVSDDPDCLFPEPMRIYPLQAFTGMIDLPNEDGKRRMPDDVLIPSIQMLLSGLEKQAENKGRSFQDLLRLGFFTLLWKLDPDVEAMTRAEIQSHFADNIAVLNALDKSRPNDQKEE